MSEEAKRGMKLFFSDKVGCTACHVGANLTDEKYHNLGIGMDKETPDLGRHAVTQEEKDTGGFKTPTIRNVELTAPYMHDGSILTLESVIDHYAAGGRERDARWKSPRVGGFDLDPGERADLLEFLRSLTDSGFVTDPRFSDPFRAAADR